MGAERKVMQEYLDALAKRADYPAHFTDDVVGEMGGIVGALSKGVEVFLHHFPLCPHNSLLPLSASPKERRIKRLSIGSPPRQENIPRIRHECVGARSRIAQIRVAGEGKF